ncbi:hypothetical protein D3C72_1892930 [compost metagenome]
MEPALQVQADGIDPGCVPAEAGRRQHLFDGRLDRRNPHEAEGLAPADQPIVGRHLEQQRVGGLHPGAAPDARGGNAAHRERNAQDDGFDARDLHGALPPLPAVRPCNA